MMSKQTTIKSLLVWVYVFYFVLTLEFKYRFSVCVIYIWGSGTYACKLWPLRHKHPTIFPFYTEESNLRSRPLRSSHGRSPSGLWRASQDPPWRTAQPPPGPLGSRPAHSTAWPAPGERGRDALGERQLFGITDICVGNKNHQGSMDTTLSVCFTLETASMFISMNLTQEFCFP